MQRLNISGNNKGITFIEVLLATVITAYVLIGLMDMFGRGYLILELNKHKAIALGLAEYKMEEIKAFPKFGKLYKNFHTEDPADNDEKTWEPVFVDKIAAERHAIITPENGNPKKIIVWVTWNDILSNTALEENLVTVVVDHDGP